ncbi:MAG TPA: STAS domain-containing protein [Herpetosiphonaceae bacterium]
MFTHLRTRVLIGGIGTVLLVCALVAFVVLERLGTNRTFAQIAALTEDAGRSRELSLYTQYGALNVVFYTRGDNVQRLEFDEHKGDFRRAIDELQAAADAGRLPGGAMPLLATIRAAHQEFDRASQQLFIATDVSRVSPLAKNQEQEDAAWRTFEQQSALLDDQSQQLSLLLNQEALRLQNAVNAANDQVMLLTILLAATVFVLIVLIQRVTTRAIGAPLDQLVATIEDFSGGNFSARAPIRRPDEIGALGEAFNAMAGTIERQQGSLVQLEVAETARAEAEAARSEIAAQLATIESQRVALREMSVPILPLARHTMVMPLVGALDGERMHDVQQRALHEVAAQGSQRLIIDITGVPVVDSYVAQGLLQAARAIQLLGAEVVLVGIRPEVAQALVGLGISMESIVTRPTLQSGIEYAMRATS